MLEAARAAAQQLVEESKALLGSSGSTAAMLSASIPAPLILPSGASPGAAAALPVARCTVSYGGSKQPSVQLQSSTGRAPATNLRAGLCSFVHAAEAEGSAASAINTLLATLLAAPVAAAAEAPLVVCGGMQLEADLAAPGCHCHPTALDATLHLGIFAAPDQQPGSSAAAPRVPVAAALFHAPAQGGAASCAWPLMRRDAATADGTTASYTLQSSGGSGPAFLLHQLQSKAVRSSGSAAATRGQAAGLAVYTAQHAAHSPAHLVQAATSPAVAIAGPAGRLSLLAGSQRQPVAAVFGAAQSALRLLQQERQHGGLQLTAATSSASPAGTQHSGSLACAAVAGLLKVAAAEAPAAAPLPLSASWDCLQPKSLSAAAPDAADIFAAAHHQHGAWIMAELREGPPQLPAAPLLPCSPGHVAISGGLGALGLLIATWLSGSCSVSLWGRSVSATWLPTALADAACAVTATQCDAAASADVAAAADTCRVTSVFIHAGALFCSRLLCVCERVWLGSEHVTYGSHLLLPRALQAARFGTPCCPSKQPPACAWLWRPSSVAA